VNIPTIAARRRKVPLSEVLNIAVRDWIDTGAIELASIAHDELPQIHEWMARYRDRPMDFA
jgi:hypothetical protein